MVKEVASFRFDEMILKGIKNFAAFLGVSQAKLIEDSVEACVRMQQVAARSHNAVWDELRSRYGDDARVRIKILNVDQPGTEEAQILIEGEERDDVLPALVLEPEAEKAHVFIDVKDWYPESVATVRIGPAVLITRPMLAAAHLPWPLAPNLVMEARLGDMNVPGVSPPVDVFHESEHVEA